MIISASRRTDIPSYYASWFMNRLREGYVLVQNPYTPRRYSRVTLTRDVVDCIVFWTKNPLPMLSKLKELDALGYPYYFQFTLTPYGRDLERSLPCKETLLEAFINVSEHVGANRIVWRYDPIVLDGQHTVGYHVKQFESMIERLKGHTNRCVISFVDPYQSVSNRLGHAPLYDMSLSNIKTLAKSLGDLGQKAHMDIVTCAEPIDLSSYHIRHGACIDQGIVEDIVGCPITVGPDRNRRSACQCVDCIDIGTYNSCLNGCVYCYAVTSDAGARRAVSMHDPLSPVMIGQLPPDALITNRSCTSICNRYMSLFPE